MEVKRVWGENWYVLFKGFGYVVDDDDDARARREFFLAVWGLLKRDGFFCFFFLVLKTGWGEGRWVN